MIGLLVVGLAALFAGALVVTFWESVVEIVVSWLEAHGLQAVHLRRVVVRLDRLVVGVRRRLWVTTDRHSRTLIEEDVVPLEDIDDSQVRDAVVEHGSVDVIMHED